MSFLKFSLKSFHKNFTLNTFHNDGILKPFCFLLKTIVIKKKDLFQRHQVYCTPRKRILQSPFNMLVLQINHQKIQEKK